MGDALPFGSREYLIFAGLLLFARAMDFLSTWVATPTLALEANPIAKWLGWRWGIVVNLGLCAGFGFYPLASTIIATTSLLVAAHNFHGAPLMRVMGETGYRLWARERLMEIPLALHVLCLLAQTLLVLAIGAALVWASGGLIITLGIGFGILGYGVAVFIFTLFGVWRRRRA
jgi:hypothetical protein